MSSVDDQDRDKEEGAVHIMRHLYVCSPSVLLARWQVLASDRSYSVIPAARVSLYRLAIELTRYNVSPGNACNANPPRTYYNTTTFLIATQLIH